MVTLADTNRVGEEDKALLRRVKHVVGSILPCAEIMLYGSVARGDHGPDSDYDLLILTEERVDSARCAAIEEQMLALELEADVVLSTIYHTRDEWRRRATLPFHEAVQSDGILL